MWFYFSFQKGCSHAHLYCACAHTMHVITHMTHTPIPSMHVITRMPIYRVCNDSYAHTIHAHNDTQLICPHHACNDSYAHTIHVCNDTQLTFPYPIHITQPAFMQVLVHVVTLTSFTCKHSNIYTCSSIMILN